jgi:hypothetical protein
MNRFIRLFCIPSIALTLLVPMPALSQWDEFTSSNLPIVVIDTHGEAIPDDPKITADMGIIDNGPGVRNAVTDPFNVYNGKIGIEVRGFSSQQFPKLQYAVETRDALGNDLAVSLLGLPADADWVLSAGYNDKSLLRNALAYHLAAVSGRYASRARFCELVLNGEYMGVYVLFEKVKRDKNRVNVTKMKTTDVDGDNVTGGYVIKIDRPNSVGEEGWYSPYLPGPEAIWDIMYLFVYPKPEDLVPAQRTYIEQFVTAFETAMNDPGFCDSTTGYRRYLDLGSAVDYFLINEMSRNVDSYRLSFYMYKDRDSKGGKLVLGPVWDYDIAFGNVNYGYGSDTVGWDLVSMPPLLAGDAEPQIPFWWPRMAEDSTFWYSAGDRWAELRATQFTSENVCAYIDSVAACIDEAQRRNFERWPILDTYVWPNAYIGGTYVNEIAYLKDWLIHRMVWMDSALPPPRTPPGDPLPIQLGSFVAALSGDGVALTWSTLSEVNNYGFYVERRAEGVAGFTQLPGVFIPGHGTTASPQVYRYLDNTATQGVWYYRLRQVDLDGKVSYTDAVRASSPTGVKETAPTEFALHQNHPNPFNPSTTIGYTVAGTGHEALGTSWVRLSVFDMLGREVAVLVNEKKDPGRYSVTFDASGLSSGMYFYRMQVLPVASAAGRDSRSGAGQFTASKKLLIVR